MRSIEPPQQLPELRAKRFELPSLLVHHIAQFRIGQLQICDPDFELLDGADGWLCHVALRTFLGGPSLAVTLPIWQGG